MTTALALLATAAAIGMAPIPRDQGFCRTDQSHYCYEWKLQSAPRQRLVARGDEDGIECTFHALDARGRYGQPVRIHPVIQDAEHQGQLFWGYAWDIRDIALAADGQSLLTSFTHTQVDGSNVDTPHGQQRIPARMTPFTLLAAAAAISAVPHAVDEEIASLRGHRHTAYNLGEPVRPDAHCRSAGAGALYERGHPVAGWEVARYDCEGKVVVTLEREASPQFGKPRMRIVDVLTVPGASFRRMDGKRQLGWTVDDGICGRTGQPESSLVVTMRWNARDEATAGDGVVRAWRFNTRRERIEPTSTRGIACMNPVP